MSKVGSSVGSRVGTTIVGRDGSDSKLKTSVASVNETLEVTESGLKAPEKKIKLKPRRKDPNQMPEAKSGDEKAKSTKAKSGEKESEKKKSESEKKTKPEVKKKSMGKTLVLRDLKTGLQKTYPYVSRFAFDKHGTRLAFVTSVVDDTSKMKSTKDDAKDKKSDKKKDNSKVETFTDGVYVVDLSNLEMTTVMTGVGEYRGVSFNESGDQLAFMTNTDDYLVKSPSWSIYHWKAGGKEAKLAAAESSAGIPMGWWISPSTSLSFTENNKRLYFSTAPVPEKVTRERNNKAEKEEEPKA